jgi:hypothetical protein
MREGGYTPSERQSPEETVERVHMNYLRDLIHRLRARQSERAIGRDLGLSRVTVHKYRLLVEKLGHLRTSLVDSQNLQPAMISGLTAPFARRPCAPERPSHPPCSSAANINAVLAGLFALILKCPS